MLMPKINVSVSNCFHPSKSPSAPIKCHLHFFNIFFCPKTYYSIAFTYYKVNSSGNEDLSLLFNRESLKEMLVISQLLKKSNNCIQQ